MRPERQSQFLNLDLLLRLSSIVGLLLVLQQDGDWFAPTNEACACEENILPEQVSVLITGFTSWNGRAYNTSNEVAKILVDGRNPHQLLLSDLPVDAVDKYSASEQIIFSITDGEFATDFASGGVIIMMGESSNVRNGQLMRIEQVVDVSNVKYTLPDDIYQKIYQRIDQYAQLDGETADDLVDFPGQVDRVGNFVCGYTSNGLAEFAASAPNSRVLPIFIHLKRTKPDHETDPRMYIILGIVEDVLREEFAANINSGNHQFIALATE